MSREHLKEAGIKYPIKLEYYKTSGEGNVETKYGIEVVKTEYLDDNVKVEAKEFKNVTNNQEEQEKILTLLRDNEVTPIAVEDVLQDLLQID